MGAAIFETSRIFSFRESIDYATGSIVSKKVLSTKGGNISLFAFDSGEELSEHTAPFDALLQIIDGSAEVKIDAKMYHLTQDQSIILPANIPHSLKAVNAFKMLLTMLKQE
jgi:quercetin dioxygenase-like cupin family protein